MSLKAGYAVIVQKHFGRTFSPRQLEKLRRRLTGDLSVTLVEVQQELKNDMESRKAADGTIEVRAVHKSVLVVDLKIAAADQDDALQIGSAALADALKKESWPEPEGTDAVAAPLERLGLALTA